MTVATGIIAALLAPLLEAVGFLEWDIQWTNSGGSAFALNLYKCNLAALAFFYMTFWIDNDLGRRLDARPQYFGDQYEMDQELLRKQIHYEESQRYQQHLEEQQMHFQQYHHYHYPDYVRNSTMDGFPVSVLMYLMLSSLLGIVIGDLAELEALRIVGARRVLVVDTVKPFAAAFFGAVILGESLHPTAFIGMVLTAAGVYIVLMATGVQNLDEKVKEKSVHGSDKTSNLSSDSGGFMFVETGGRDLHPRKGLGLMHRPLSKHSLESLKSNDDISYFDADDGSSVSSAFSERSDGSSEDFFLENIPPMGDDENIGSAIIDTTSFENSSASKELFPTTKFQATPLNKARSWASESSFITTESECGPPPGYYQNVNNRERKNDRKKRLRRGYFLALLNVLLDAYGALLVKQYATHLNTWEINLIRYGFAGFLLACISIGLRIRDNIFLGTNERRKKFGIKPTVQIDSPPDSYQSNIQESIVPWYRLPNMCIQSWITISLGVVFVTFLCPALSSYALFEIALALAVTLNSTTPLYMLPLMWLVKQEKPITF